MCCFTSQLVHDKELAAEDEQVFLMKQQVRSPVRLEQRRFVSGRPAPWGTVKGYHKELAATKGLLPVLVIPSRLSD